MEEQLFECDACHRTFVSARSLQSHYRHCKVGTHVPYKVKNKSKYKTDSGLYKCECGREFTNPQSLNAHFAFCLQHKHECGMEEKVSETKIRKGDKCNFSRVYLGDDKFNDLSSRRSKTRRNNFISGKTIPAWKGRHCSASTKEKLRLAAIKRIEKIKAKSFIANFNPDSIAILESIAHERGWNIQHALNGGEVRLDIGYFLDAYDKDKNIVLEYDEAKHYIDAENNVLSEKDLVRQKNIIDYLHCEYWRYNEVTKQLWRSDLGN